jgi:hypothetical protein
MASIKKVTESDIESISFILKNFKDQEKKVGLITMQSKKFLLTYEFIREFKEYMTKESFSSSPGINYQLIKYFPELFDVNLWANSSEKSLEPLLHEEFTEELPPLIIGRSFETCKADLITKEIYDKFSLIIPEQTKVHIVNNTSLADDINFLMENISVINESLLDNPRLKIDWTNDLIEKILTNKELTFKFVVKILSKTTDFAFIERMLKTSFIYKQTGGTLDDDLRLFIKKLPEDYLEPLFDCAKINNPNALSYAVLQYILKMKDEISEQFLLDYINEFKEVGLNGELASYARLRDYKSVLLNLHLS